MLRSLIAAVFASLAIVQTAQATAPEIQALLTHETINQRSDGVTETFRYQERLTRIDDNVWLERVLPATRKVVAQPGTAGDHGPNLQLLPRWMRRSPDGMAMLTLVDREDRFRIAVKTIEYGRLGYSGNWATESSLIDPATIRNMKPSVRASTDSNSRWYEAARKGRYSRVLWNDLLQFPLVIETGSDDGRNCSRTTVQFEALPKTRPWTGLDSWLEHEIDDFGD